jgi:hypothetical protein
MQITSTSLLQMSLCAACVQYKFQHEGNLRNVQRSIVSGGSAPSLTMQNGCVSRQAFRLFSIYKALS